MVLNCRANRENLNTMYKGIIYQYKVGEMPTRTDKIKAARKPIVCIETNETFLSVYDAAKKFLGEDASKKKCRIQAALKKGWAVDGKHFEYMVHDDPVLSETEV